MSLKPLLAVNLLLAALTLIWTLPTQADVYCDQWTKVYHQENCEKVKDIKKGNFRVYQTEPEAEVRGYYPCQLCLPPQSKDVNETPTRQYRSIPVKKIEGYIGDAGTKVCHHSWCALVESIEPKDRVRFSKIDDAWDKQYTPCQVCYPPVKPKKQYIQEEEKENKEQKPALIQPEPE